MKPSPEQIRQAGLKHQKPSTTAGAQVCAAIEHAKQSRVYAAVVKAAQVLQNVG